MSRATFELMQSEAEFQSAVGGLATLNGWDWFHIMPGLNDRGRWRSPVQGSLGAGWPDLVMVKGERIIFAELKSARGIVTPIQKRVLSILAGVPSAEIYVWRPSDWPLICEVLVGVELEGVQYAEGG